MQDISIDIDRMLHEAPPALPGAFDDLVAASLAQRREEFGRCLHAFSERSTELSALVAAVVEALRSGGKLLVAGNGGSAAEAQHFVGELVGRFRLERRPYAAIALCVDSAVVTAVGNDYGFDDVFARQVRALGRAGDALLAISTSGESPNLLRAAEAARGCGMRVLAVTGDRDNRLVGLADVALRVPATDTPLVQELQMMVTHVVCGITEAHLAAAERDERRLT